MPSAVTHGAGHEGVAVREVAVDGGDVASGAEWQVGAVEDDACAVAGLFERNGAAVGIAEVEEVRGRP